MRRIWPLQCWNVHNLKKMNQSDLLGSQQQLSIFKIVNSITDNPKTRFIVLKLSHNIICQILNK